MEFNLIFLINSVLLGVGLSMDAFSVSLANGLHEPGMGKKKMCLIAGVYGFFQALMPMAGWVCVHTVIRYFRIFEAFIPWIALFLLVYIGSKMIMESRDGEEDDQTVRRLDMKTLLIQGIATSIDALSVGFTIAGYRMSMALLASCIIAAVTFVICTGGLILGRHFGTRLAGKASILGGVILIGIGIEIFIKGMFF